jgi:ferric-dicitrate binding protein FerR (iron transport regulator)
MGPTLRYDHYKVLGVARDADVDTIKRAFREKAKHCHPDRTASPRAEEAFRAVYEAWRVLRDPGRRAAYDRALAGYRSAPSPLPRPAPPRPFNLRRTPRPATAWQRAAYTMLHITGLLFGFCSVSSVAMGLAWHAWPAWTLVAAIPGAFAIPASWSGLRHAGAE